MTALVQSFPSPTPSLTMLQSRPSTEAFQNGSQTQQHQRSSQVPRNVYNASVGGIGTGNYRGHASISPVAPYAFTTTPGTLNNANPLRQHPIAPLLRQENRTSSAPTIPFTHQTLTNITSSNRNFLTGPPFSPALDSPTAAPFIQQSGSKDDTSISSTTIKQTNSRPISSIELSVPTFAGPTSYSGSAKPSPDRYRRNHRRVENSGVQTKSRSPQGRSASPSGSGMAAVSHFYNNPLQSNSTPTLTSYPAFRGLSQQHNDGSVLQGRVSSVDDMNLPRQSSAEQAKRYRRRSVSSLEVKEHTIQISDPKVNTSFQTKSQAATFAGSASQEKHEKHENQPLVLQRPRSAHGRNDSSESSISSPSISRPSSSKREGPTTATISPAALQATPIAKNEAKLVNIPPRASSDANKRLANPSPLSKPLAMSTSTSNEPSTVTNSPGSLKPLSTIPNPPQIGIPESPAAQHLAALNKKDGKKEGKSSRLRRAFSFGSAAELRKASAENHMNNNSPNERAKLRKDRYHNEHDAREAEQAAIAQKQEAAGLGQGIYSGQGHFHTGSTDNLSISSTASSASVMIRKMGQGMKKGSRSLVGLFRPKSAVGTPTVEPKVPEPSVAQVSMVTVEAEREKVNVNVNPHDQAGGGTGFPKLERNSIDAASIANEPELAMLDRGNDIRPRRSIVGGEKERAEVLAAVKKGILKRTGTDSGNSSPVVRPIDVKASDFSVPQPTAFIESPGSSTPSTPAEDQPRLGHRRTDSLTIEGEDYFLTLAKFASGDSRSIPGTPRSIAVRNITFSPRIQFHDTWPSGEYDRRGEIATCNRLTPMLAQQIKEELNTFKMEMEVHEQSKVYTHFF